MVFEWAISETCFQETGFSVSDFQEGDFENAIPRIGFRELVFLMPVGMDRFYLFLSDRSMALGQ